MNMGECSNTPVPLLAGTGRSLSHILTYFAIHKDILSKLSNLFSFIHFLCNVFNVHCMPGMELGIFASGFRVHNLTTLLAFQSLFVSFHPPSDLKSHTTNSSWYALSAEPERIILEETPQLNNNIHSFVCSLIKYLLGTCYVPGTVLTPGILPNKTNITPA